MGGDEVVDFYENRYDESVRLEARENNIEFVRTTEILSRFLPEPPATILDLGGGAGIYAEWLAHQGYDVTLIDPVERHVVAANQITAAPGSIAASVGDARRVDLPDESVDAVVMLGPLYHLVERPDRVTAWSEARRVCRPGGFIAAAVISRFASFHDMLTRDQFGEAGVAEMVTTALTTGQHRNPDNVEGRFTAAYFHDPAEIADEALAAGVTLDHIIGVESIAADLASTEAQLANARSRDIVLSLLRQVEAEPSLLGVSSHIVAIAQR